VEALTDGHYALKQLGCKSRIISWSHAARFRTAISLAGSDVTATLLDYGCGDGTFLKMVAQRFARCVGADIAADQLADCAKRLGSVSKLRFCEVRDLASSEHSGAYQVVTCMETLEHCTDNVVELVVSDLARLVAPEGRVIISVPIEIGPTFLLKYAVRKMAAWRGLSDYRYYESYSFPNALRMLFANRATLLWRPVHGEPGAESHSHYGFNWRRLRSRLEQSFTIDRMIFSPFDCLGGWFSSQVWFVCRPSVLRPETETIPTPEFPSDQKVRRSSSV
jgi:SAM-dependent methyltransferase